jgi:hypothetical protein
MTRYFKTLLIWILIAVLPLNAGAAAVGMSCPPGHQQAMQVAMSHDASHSMGGDTGHHSDGAHHASAVAADSLQAQMDSGIAGQPDCSTHSTCSGCSAFCMGSAAPPPVFVSIPSFSGAEDLIVSPAPRVSGFIPEGLRRPPRQPSA